MWISNLCMKVIASLNGSSWCILSSLSIFFVFKYFYLNTKKFSLHLTNLHQCVGINFHQKLETRIKTEIHNHYHDIFSEPAPLKRQVANFKFALRK